MRASRWSAVINNQMVAVSFMRSNALFGMSNDKDGVGGPFDTSKP